MSKKGIFSTDSKAQLRHERSKRFAVSMMIKKDMEEKERERQRFERQLERDLDELDRKYGTSTDYSYSNTHHRKTASKTVPSEPPESQAMLYWAGTVMIVLSFSSILYMIGNSSEFLMLSYNLSSLAAIGTIGTICIKNIITRKKGARWRCLIVGIISYVLTIIAQMIYPDEAKRNHVSSMPTEYPPIMLIFFAGAILGFTLMAVLITNSMCKDNKDDEKKGNVKKHNNTKKDSGIPDLLRTELNNQPHEVKAVPETPAQVKTEPQKTREPLVYKYYDNTDGHLGYWDLNKYFTKYDKLENLAREEEILINATNPEELNEQHRRNAEEYRKNMPEWARGKLSEEYAVEVINDTLR